MDTSKQPGINTNEIFMTKCLFERRPVNFNQISVNCAFSYSKQTSSENKGTSMLSLHATGMSEVEDSLDNQVFDAVIEFVAYFEAVEPINMPLDTFLNSYAQGHLLPYIREVLSSITMKAGLPPIILPPVNVAGLVSAEIHGTMQKGNDQETTLNFIQN